MPLIGSFVFRNDGDGCLSSKYMNNNVTRPYTECCISTDDHVNNQSFEGHYYSTWLEPGGVTRKGVLKIELKDSSSGLYELTWSDQKGAVVFEGQGMIYQHLLAGFYHEVSNTLNN